MLESVIQQNLRIVTTKAEIIQILYAKYVDYERSPLWEAVSVLLPHPALQALNCVVNVFVVLKNIGPIIFHDSLCKLPHAGVKERAVNTS